MAATLVTGITLDRVSRSVANLAVENLGASAVNARFAEIGQAIRVEVPALGDAQTQFERETALERLTDHFGGIRELLGQAKRSEGGYSVGLGDVISSLEANIRDLDTNVGKRFFLKSALAQQVTRINRLHGDFLLEVEPLLTDARFNVGSALRHAGGTGGAHAFHHALVAEEVRATEALGRLHANANLAVGLILRAASENEYRAIEYLQGRLAETVEEANETAAMLVGNSSSITLRQLWHQLARFSDGEDSLLNLKLRESGLLSENMQLQETSGALLTKLGDLVAGAVRESGRRSELASEEIAVIVSNAHLLNAASTAILLALLLAFSVVFVRGKLLLRLMDVLSSMRLIADGKTDISVPVSGPDEIGQLADAVRLFQDKSRALDVHATELRRSNEALLEEIDLRRRAETELRETQAELIQAAKLAALGQLSAGIAHEFNQPLMAMRSYTHNALRYVERGDLDKIREKLADMDRVIGRLSKSSNHLKRFARRPQEVVTRHDLSDVASNALSLFEERLAREGVHVRWDRPEHPVHVMTEPALLEQVLVNLISNALDAMREIASPQLVVGVSETGKLARVSIRDSGAGFSDEVRDRLFDPFFTTKPPGEGLGLGLSISYNVIRDLGGRLEVRRARGGGVLATVELFKS